MRESSNKILMVVPANNHGNFFISATMTNFRSISIIS